MFNIWINKKNPKQTIVNYKTSWIYYKYMRRLFKISSVAANMSRFGTVYTYFVSFGVIHLYIWKWYMKKTTKYRLIMERRYKSSRKSSNKLRSLCWRVIVTLGSSLPMARVAVCKTHSPFSLIIISFLMVISWTL